MSDISKIIRNGRVYQVTNDLCVPIGEKTLTGDRKRFRGTLSNKDRRQVMRMTKTPYNLWLEKSAMEALRQEVEENQEKSLNVFLNKIVGIYLDNPSLFKPQLAER